MTKSPGQGCQAEKNGIPPARPIVREPSSASRGRGPQFELKGEALRRGLNQSLERVTFFARYLRIEGDCGSVARDHLLATKHLVENGMHSGLAFPRVHVHAVSTADEPGKPPGQPL
jgi:hypothetical protein